MPLLLDVVAGAPVAVIMDAAAGSAGRAPAGTLWLPEGVCGLCDAAAGLGAGAEGEVREELLPGPAAIAAGSCCWGVAVAVPCDERPVALATAASDAATAASTPAADDATASSDAATAASAADAISIATAICEEATQRGER